jgi:hypothetical protein
MWAGDSISHNIDSLTLETNIDHMVKVTEMVQTGLKDVPIWAAIGNHDNYPQDVFKAHKPRENEAVNEWGKKWREFDFLKDPV